MAKAATAAALETNGNKAETVEQAVRKLVIPKINVEEVVLRVEELSPLICNRFSEKARQMMLDKQMKTAVKAKEAKDPEALFRASLYVVSGKEDLPDGTQGKYFLPGVMFKKCAVGACRFLGKDIPMTKARGAFFVIGDPILDFDALVMREDYVRNATGVADIRFRGEFQGWGADVVVSFNASVISLDQLVNLLNVGGFSQGVGDYRPSSESGGEYGRFKVVGVAAR